MDVKPREAMKKANRFGGSAGGGGYSYQSEAIAYVSAHILAQGRLGWISHSGPDVPVAVAIETGGPGDDLNIFLEDQTHIEVQAKKGLQKSHKFWTALLRLAHGVADNPSLHAVLLVDSTTSSTIRTHLRNDLVRLADGRSDDLKSITNEFLGKLQSADLDVNSVASRLNIVVRDFGPGSSGEALGRPLLLEVLEDRALCSAAWGLLVKDGLDLITHRGQRDAATLSRFFMSNGIILSKSTSNFHVLSESFRSWVFHSNNTFTVAGLGVALPITKAWMQLRTFDDEEQGKLPGSKGLEGLIAQYHEWERLADKGHYRTSTEAEHVAAFNPRVVVVGGPGAGKSTLLRRLAYRYSAEHKTVLKIRLPLAAQRMEKVGDGFEDALINVAGDGSGIAFKNLRRLLPSPDYLLADGLDECYPHRSAIANALVKWAHGHQQTTIIVTTRPVGHDPGILPDWKHFELLPLDKSDSQEYARQILMAYFDGETSKVEEELVLFEDHLRKSAVASLAARNPLLLGFLIQLSISRIEIGKRRARLYEQVVNLLQRTFPQDRAASVNLEDTVTSRFFEVFGWLLQENPAQPKGELIKQAGDMLKNELGVEILEARRLAELSLRFWEEHRLLETLSVGGQEVVTFIHVALCEYAAGRYVATLVDTRLEEWLTQIRREPKWRETILLAAGAGDVGRIVRNLIKLDNVGDPTSTEAVLAAAAQSEAGGIQPALAECIADRLLARLTSNIPVIVYEAGHAALGLSLLVPKTIGPLARSLLDHEYPWTRFVAWILTLHAGKEYVDVNLLEKHYEITLEPELAGTPGLIIDPTDKSYDLKCAYLGRATEMLLDERRTPEVVERIEAILNRDDLSWGMKSALEEVLVKKGLQKIVRKSNEKWFRLVNSLFVTSNREVWLAADKALLEAIISAFDDVSEAGSEVITSHHEELLSLSALFEAMKVGESSIRDYLVFAERKDVESLIFTIRGAVAALRLKPKRVVLEARLALKRLGDKSGKSLITILRNVDVTPDWHMARNTDLDGSILAQALDHPSTVVAFTAAELLYAGAGGDETPNSVKNTLEKGGPGALRVISIISSQIWGDKALPMILNRLDGKLSEGCEYLFRELPKLASNKKDDRIYKCLLKGIMAPSPEVAEGAAQACTELDFPETYADEIRGAFDHWKDHEPPYPVGGGVIPHSPRAYLLRTLVKLKEFTVDELLVFCSDVRSDVRDVAIDALVEKAKADKEALKDTLKRIKGGIAPSIILKKLMNLPSELLRKVKDEILSLLKSPHSDVRCAIVMSLGMAWVDSVEATRLAKEMLRDKAPEIRNEATRTLRLITGR